MTYDRASQTLSDKSDGIGGYHGVKYFHVTDEKLFQIDTEFFHSKEGFDLLAEHGYTTKWE